MSSIHSLIPFNDPAAICISGPTGSGKTYFVNDLIQNLAGIFKNEIPTKILYCYGVWQKLFETIESENDIITFHDGLPSKIEIDEFSSDFKHKLIILDDLLDEVLNSSEMQKLFIRECHHKNISCIFITQNIFSKGKHSRTINLNTSYLILFRNFRDSSQIKNIGKQIYPGNTDVLYESYQDATENNYGYLLVDLSPHADDLYRLRTFILPGEDTVVYVKK